METEVLREAVEKFGTPLYLYDLEVVRFKIKELKRTLPSDSKLYISIKANPLKEFCDIARQEKCGIEVASGGELRFVLKAGIDSQNVIFSGPGKTKDELRLAIKSEVHMINVESLLELEYIQQLSCEEKKEANVALRINPSGIKGVGRVKMCGVSSQFGIEEDDINEALFEKIKSFSHVKLKGVQLYMGTSILNAIDIYRNTEYILQFAEKITDKYRLGLVYINAGGGFGIPYYKGDKKLDIQLLGSKMKEIECNYKKYIKGKEFVFESGRYVLAECGMYLIKVLYKKISKGNTYLVCDGGANFHSASAFLGRCVRNNFPMYVLERGGEKSEFYVTGPLCTPVDLLGQKVSLPKDTKEGDVIVIIKSGAYGLTYSPYGFLSHKLPLEVGYTQDRGVQLLSRERG